MPFDERSPRDFRQIVNNLLCLAFAAPGGAIARYFHGTRDVPEPVSAGSFDHFASGPGSTLRISLPSSPFQRYRIPSAPPAATSLPSREVATPKR